MIRLAWFCVLGPVLPGIRQCMDPSWTEIFALRIQITPNKKGPAIATFFNRYRKEQTANLTQCLFLRSDHEVLKPRQLSVRIKAVQHFLRPAPARFRRQFEHYTAAISATERGRAVHIAGGVDDQTGVGGVTTPRVNVRVSRKA
jgi:hypothetical protein